MNKWVDAVLRALFIWLLGFFLIEIADIKISWLLVGIVSIIAFLLQFAYSHFKKKHADSKWPIYNHTYKNLPHIEKGLDLFLYLLVPLEEMRKQTLWNFLFTRQRKPYLSFVLTAPKPRQYELHRQKVFFLLNVRDVRLSVRNCWKRIASLGAEKRSSLSNKSLL